MQTETAVLETIKTSHAENGGAQLSVKPSAKKERWSLALVTLVGLPPGMMQSAMSEEQLDVLPGGTKAGAKIQRKSDATAEEIASDRAHRDVNGKMGVPAEQISATLVETGRRVPYEGKSKLSTLESTFFHECVILLPSSDCMSGGFFPFAGLSEDGEIPWKVDKRRGRNEATNGANCIIRPRFASWNLPVAFLFDTTKIQLNTVKRLFQLAGLGVGLGEFRPGGSRGPFGRFVPKEWRVLEREEWDTHVTGQVAELFELLETAAREVENEKTAKKKKTEGDSISEKDTLAGDGSPALGEHEGSEATEEKNRLAKQA